MLELDTTEVVVDPDVMFQTTTVFNANSESTAKIVVNQGGTSASKTYSIIQLLFYRAIQKKRIITVTGESLPNLKKGAYRDAEAIYDTTPLLRPYVNKWNMSNYSIYLRNGSIIEFLSNLTEQGAKSGRRHILFANEANGIPWNIFWQLAIRTREQIFIDYNPTAKFWAHHKLIGTTPETNDLSATVELLISDHRHNCFLPAADHQKIEGIKDPKRWQVYARGKTGELEGQIFRFTKVTSIPEGLEFGFGIDFGYNVDKTSLVKVYIDGEKRYYHELLYEVGVDTTKIANIMKANGCETSTYVWGDHDKTASVYLRRQHIPFRMARKGTDSVKLGISKINEFENFYYDSPNLEKELETFLWDKGVDVLTGNEVFLNVPVEGYEDHSIAAIRYFIYSHSLRFVS